MREMRYSFQFSLCIVLLLTCRLWLPHEVLAISKVTTNLTANHHGQFIDAKLRRCSIVSPVVVIRATYSIEFIWVLVFDDLLSNHVVVLYSSKRKFERV
jgi:hypothetical protein